MKSPVINLSSQRPIRIGRISYVNVDPIYYGLDRLEDAQNIDIISAPPAELNALMASNQLDISAVSSVAYARHQDDWLLIPGLAIACRENVMSVLLVGKYSIHSLQGRRVAITDESATAAALLKLMLAVHQVAPAYKIKKIRTPSDIGMNTAAALVIGDAALRHPWSRLYEYTWDLGDLWAQHAGLPFVFAVWAVRKSFSEKYPEAVAAISDALLRSKAIGMANLNAVIQNASQKLNISESISARYFNNFCYTLEPPQSKGLQAFYQDLYEYDLLHREVTIRFFK
jgi:chorismate dehydratase